MASLFCRIGSSYNHVDVKSGPALAGTVRFRECYGYLDEPEDPVLPLLLGELLDEPLLLGELLDEPLLLLGELELLLGELDEPLLLGELLLDEPLLLGVLDEPELEPDLLK